MAMALAAIPACLHLDGYQFSPRPRAKNVSCASSRARKWLVLGERWLDYYYRIDEDPAVTA